MAKKKYEKDWQARDAWGKEKYLNESCRLPQDLVLRFREEVKRRGDSKARVFALAMIEYLKESEERDPR